jgi:hypothetical protein
MAITPLPPWTGEPFTREQAVSAGLSDTVLRGRRFRRLFRGVYVSAAVELEVRHWILAAVLAMPAGSVASHVSALRLYGFTIGPLHPFHVSTESKTHTRHPGIVPHQRKHRIGAVVVDGVPVTGPDRTIVDIATKVTFIELVQAIEVMLHRGHTTLDRLTRYALDRHLDGVRRTRRALTIAREGAESPMETLVRLMIVFARLPEPIPNLQIRDDHGLFLARGDLVLPRWRILVEYDGWHHELDADQRVRDIGRRERLEAAGWRLIIVTAGDLRQPQQIVRRVHAALVERGWTGPNPVFSDQWETWFDPKKKPANPKKSAASGRPSRKRDPKVPTYWTGSDVRRRKRRRA